MSGSTEFLPFATGGGANVVSQATYSAGSWRTAGFGSGEAAANQANKALRQGTFMAAVVATFMANQLAAAVNDDGDLATAVTNLGGALAAFVSNKAPLVSPALTGTPTAPTASAADNTTKIATTAFVSGAISTLSTAVTSAITSAVAGLAPLASPAFTGTPTAPTQSAGNNTTRLATTAFVTAAVGVLASTVASNLSAAITSIQSWVSANFTTPSQVSGIIGAHIQGGIYTTTGTYDVFNFPTPFNNSVIAITATDDGPDMRSVGVSAISLSQFQVFSPAAGTGINVIAVGN